MCGCMLMHAVMNHEEHQHSSSHQPMPASGASATPAATGQKCLHCDFPLGQGFAFCPNCGMRLQEKNCSACGQKVDPGWKACAYCGSPLSEVEKQPVPH
jgi:RNA polymerase subunit RPABC4/transcription elongation factor Spt4